MQIRCVPPDPTYLEESYLVPANPTEPSKPPQGDFSNPEEFTD